MSFRFNILADFYWESGVDKVLDRLSAIEYRRFFVEQCYGSSLEGITVVLMCQNPDLNLKQRIRFSKKEKKIYLDLMLDLNQFLLIDQRQKERVAAEKLIKEIPVIISKYKLDDFNLSKFELDLKKALSVLL